MKIIDFGVAKQTEQHIYNFSANGFRRSLAPEILRGEPYR